MSVERERVAWRRMGGLGLIRSHHVILEVGDKFSERLSALIRTDGPFQITYLCVLDLLLLFHLPVLRNKSSMSFH